MFPSPRGDELFQFEDSSMPGASGFRPLAGVSCFCLALARLRPAGLFPSPRGDELFRSNEKAGQRNFWVSVPSRGGVVSCDATRPWIDADGRFRPLAGMSCFYCSFAERLEVRFPSPRGDELFRCPAAIGRCPNSFRPLAGMSCFLILRASWRVKKVSVPSRG